MYIKLLTGFHVDFLPELADAMQWALFISQAHA